MVLISNMKILKIILAFLIFTVGFSCENKELALTNIAFINCSECSIEEPLNATVKLKLVDPFKFGEASPVIQIDIYEGKWYTREDVKLEAGLMAQMYILREYPHNAGDIRIISLSLIHI